MIGRLTAVVVVLLAATALYKLSTLRRGATAAQAALAGVFVCLAIGVLPFTGWHIEILGNSPRVQLWGNVFARIFVIAAAGLAQIYVLLLAHDLRSIRRQVLHRLALAAAVGVGVVLLALLTPQWASRTSEFEVWPEWVMHVLFLVYLAVALTGVAQASLAWADACTGAVGTGLRLVAGGAALGIAYAVGKVVATVIEMVSGPPQGLVVASQLAALAGLVLVAIGSALPAADRWWRSLRHVIVARQRLDLLYPLWSDLVDIVPGIAFEPVQPRWRDRLHVRDLDMRLYRRVIEIRDGQLALSRTDVVRTQVGRCADLRRALVAPDPSGAPATVDDEVTWWSQVATSYRHLRRDELAARP